MYDKMAAQVGMTKKEFVAELKRRKAYNMETEVKAFNDIKNGVFVDYSSLMTEVIDEIGEDED